MQFGIFSTLACPEGYSNEAVYEQGLRQFVAADHLGYETVWLAEHHFSRRGTCPAPTILAAAVAGRTSRLRVGLAVSLPAFHDPIRLAEDLAVLDHVSGGRLNVGIGRGGLAKEFEVFGGSLAENRDRVAEALELMLKCWTEDDFSFAGRFRNVSELTVYPKPKQKPHPPLYMATNSPDSTAIAAQTGLIPLMTFFTGDRTIRERRDEYVPHAVAAGHDEQIARARRDGIWVARLVYVAETEAAAKADPEPYLMSFYGEQGSRHTTGKGGYDLIFGQSYEYYLRDDSTMFGTPDQVAERIARFREATGVENLICYTAFHGLDPEKALRSMDLFAVEVMPRFR